MPDKPNEARTYYCFTYRTVYHIIGKSKGPGYPYTLCGLGCVNGRTVAARPGFIRLCKRCAKWLSPDEKEVGDA